MVRKRFFRQQNPDEISNSEVIVSMLSDMRKSIEEMDKRSERRFEEMDERFEQIDKRLARSENEIKKIGGKIDSAFSRIDTLSKRIGNVHERSFRKTLEDRYGKMYVRSFLATNLIGLGRLLKEKELSYPNVDSIEQISLAKKLAASINDKDVEELKATILKKSIHILSQRKIHYSESIPLLDMLLSAKDERDDEDDEITRTLNNLIGLLKDTSEENYYMSSFGFAAFVFSVVKNIEKNSIYSALEFDCRGIVNATKVSMTYDFAEIKSSGDSGAAKKALMQLKIRARLLLKAANIVFEDKTIYINARSFLTTSGFPHVEEEYEESNKGNITYYIEYHN